ncbi:6-phospho-3-hexuloisomerase [Enterococcus hulanensis]|uniref:6-phospho-3-hexuloisomerase n=1 Tax=Enterococcus hulanensis TaxID=2559929 RepID=A0ABU3F316_9ENTE|nr:6-phospho-3-hexuloisomerase [Enterococcus hulanensis]MDT2601527.1 6-phospho-3-hexuloisomerase [Enterococcus hulanensis]MDT2610930.1 6-phospho-3-hexuloisomerase [Enterococcus hulanensis]MDT2618335.1 6-phospho-3-hexuloisomerase [Enterococcus hulanensis]MDT2629462.1 6-phospho-3-hexuloisomerase [Enterococcus hulanensis]MDT2657024.1 6-phospho-3-hexuloisomerase [Enterococcus hulanensis]
MESKNLNRIVSEIITYSVDIDDQSIKKVARLCSEANRIFVAGAGRSGFAARGFANRLMQLGFKAYFVGETTTPSIKKGDLLIIGSGSGNTNSLVVDAEVAKKVGAKLVTLTIFPDGLIGKQADSIIVLPGETPKNDSDSKKNSIQPMGTLFEQLSWLTYDSIVLELMNITNTSEESMFNLHANLE